MPSLRLSVLGPLLIELDGAPVQLETRKAAALIAYLAVEGQPASRASLAAMFWPEFDPERAYHNLRRSLWACNKALGKEWLEAGTELIAFQRQRGFWLDTQAFQGHLDGCSQAPAAPDCLAALSSASEIYRGEFMAGFSLPDSPSFDEWQFFQREHWRSAFRLALIRLVQGCAELGEVERAIQFARRWLALDPLDEQPTIELMRLYTQSGQRAAALRQYDVLAQLLEKELGVLPQVETTAMYQQIRAGAEIPGSAPRPLEPVGATSSPAPARPRQLTTRPSSNLPVALTPFIGRGRELVEISKLLADPTCRLLTLLGPGGIGKTRLAIQAAEEKEFAFAQGACFVPLAPLTATEHIPSAVAGALQVPFSASGKDLRQQLLDFIRQKEILFVFDNFEHLLGDESLGLLLELVSSASLIKILVTSRLRLNLQGEHVFVLSGLETPERAAASTVPPENNGYSALQLFQQRARRVRPDFKLEGENLAHAIAICQAVQGMPLAIELAAAWLDLLAPAEIAVEIQKNLDFLETSQRDVPERQRSIRAIFNATWDLLSPAEQNAFMRLSIFQGGFTRQAAETVAGASLRELAALGNKALLYRRPPERYEVHELLRQFAAEALQADRSRWLAVRQQHSHYYLQELAAFGKAIHGPGFVAAREAVEAEIDNLRAAWQCAVEHRQFSWIEAALYGFFFYFTTRALSQELDRHLWDALHALETLPPDREQQLLSVKLRTLISWITYDFMTDYAPQLLRSSLATVRALQAEQELGNWFTLLVSEYGWRVNPQEGLELLQQQVERLRAQGDEQALAVALQVMANGMIKLKETGPAKKLLEEAIAICQRLGDRVSQAENYRFLAELLFQERSYADAMTVVQQSREIYDDLGDKNNALFNRMQMGRLTLALGEYEQSVQIHEEALALTRAMGLLNMEAACLSWQSIAYLRLGDLDAARRGRLASLAISRRINELTDIVWGTYELGEIERVSGDFEAAERDYRECLQRFQDREMTQVLAFYHKGMGDLSVVRRRWGQARQHFEDSLVYAQRDYNFWCMAYATDGLGRVALGQGDYATARSCFKSALEKALELGDRTLVMAPLAHLASLSAAQGEYERAAGLSAFVIYQVASWHETRLQARQVFDAAAGQLTAQAAAAAQARGQQADLETVVQLLIADPSPEDLA